MYKIFLSLSFAVKSLISNFGRTLLTLSGVIIGTVAILVVASLGDTVERYVLDQVQSFGEDIIQTEVKVPSEGRNSAGSARGIAQGITITALTRADGEAIAKLPNVATYYAAIMGQFLMHYREKNSHVMMLGATVDAIAVDRGMNIAEGSFFSQSDDRGAAQVIVLGSGVRNDFFGESEAVGAMITIKDQKYRVIGVLEERGSTGFVNFDDFAYIPLETMQKKLLGVDHVSYIMTKIESTLYAEATARDIEDLLRDRHNIKKVGEEDFSVTTIQEAQKTVQTIFGAIRILLIALASISLVVGGVGIMNVLFVSVTERTTEIGLRKAVGARSQDILRQFLVEAIIVALLGCVFGIVIAFIFIFLVFQVIALLGISLTFVFSFSNLALAVGFSFVTGIIFGTYPALKASRIDPIQAIRNG